MFDEFMEAVRAINTRSLKRIAADTNLDDEEMRFVVAVVHKGAAILVGSAVWDRLQGYATRPGGEALSAVLGLRIELCPYMDPGAIVAIGFEEGPP